MKYSDLVADQAVYRSVPSGGASRVVINRVDTGDPIFIGNTTGISVTEAYEQNAIEEAGEDGVNEISTGRHSGQANVQGFYRLEVNDLLETRQNFLGDGEGREYQVMIVRGDKRKGENIPIDVFTGCKISQKGMQLGARGPMTFSLSFMFLRRYSGQEWATFSGDQEFFPTST